MWLQYRLSESHRDLPTLVREFISTPLGGLKKLARESHSLAQDIESL